MAQEPRIDDFDRDALHILPLSIIPFQTPSLRRARLIKNARLESVVEFFRGEKTGSGQLDINAVGMEFGWNRTHPDMVVLDKLGGLNSYDVYSLRILLRAHGIEIENHEDLRLSESKNQELTGYMKEFTNPLIVQIYGDEDRTLREFRDVVALFKNPDVEKAREKLKIMADKLEIGLEQVPTFLEDYADIFLSLAYYRQCLDDMRPTVDDFLSSVDDIQSNFQLKGDRHLMETCTKMRSTINGRMAGIRGRFESFDLNTRDMWKDLTAERFRKVETMIRSYHTTIGGVLCALSVKLKAWERLFPKKGSGGPVRRAEFIMSDMKQGIDNIQEIEDQNPCWPASIEKGQGGR